MPDVPTNRDDDGALVARCLRGDAAAWETLVARYQRLVYAVARRAGHDEHIAADVFQTVFARLLEHLPRLDHPERLQAWIVTTAKRESILLSRRAKRSVALREPDDSGQGPLAADLPDTSPLPDAALEDLQQLNQLRLGLDRLDHRCRELLVMMFADDDDKPSYEAIARRLGMPVGSLGPTRARCLDKLRRLLA